MQAGTLALLSVEVMLSDLAAITCEALLACCLLVLRKMHALLVTLTLVPHSFCQVAVNP